MLRGSTATYRDVSITSEGQATKGCWDTPYIDLSVYVEVAKHTGGGPVVSIVLVLVVIVLNYHCHEVVDSQGAHLW